MYIFTGIVCFLTWTFIHKALGKYLSIAALETRCHKFKLPGSFVISWKYEAFQCPQIFKL